MTILTPARAITAAAFILAAATLLATSPAATAQATDGPAALGAVRAATARFHDLNDAQAAGYSLLKDAAGIACIDSPGVGAMGVHYANTALVGSGTVDPARPQALVYEPMTNGRMRLGAVEYVVLQADWDATHKAPPALFGQEFMLTPAGNRYGLPAFYSLHAWVWKDNPTGTFSMYNPQVSCQTAATGDPIDDLR